PPAHAAYSRQPRGSRDAADLLGGKLITIGPFWGARLAAEVSYDLLEGSVGAASSRDDSMRAMMLIALSAWSAWAAPSLWAAEPALVSDPSVVADAPSEALQAFGRWAARQELYSRSMIVDMRQRLRDKLASLAPDEAAQLRDDVL